MEPRFEQVRDQLDAQYDHNDYNPASGLSVEETTEKCRAYFQAHRQDPRIRTRAMLFSMAMANARVRVDRFDRFADHIELCNILAEVQKIWIKESESGLPPDMISENQANYNDAGAWAHLDLSHTCPDWVSIFSLGIPGLIDRAKTSLAAAGNEEEKEFCQAVVTVYNGLLTYTEHLEKEAENVGAKEVAEVLKNLTVRAPQTFREAIQLALIYHRGQEFEQELVRSMGRFDQLYIDFYRRDLAAGILTRDEARELIQFYWMKFYANGHGTSMGKNFCFGGYTPDGEDGCNELTEVAFEAYFAMKTPDPKLSFRYTPKTPEKQLRQVTNCLAHGMTSIVFANDEVLVPMFQRRGKTLTDARDYTLIGCYEPAIMGREMPCTMAGLINLAKPLELVFHNGQDVKNGDRLGLPCELPETMEALEKEYFRQLEHLLRRLLSRAVEFEKTWPEVNPSPLLSGSMRDCMKKRQDVSGGGVKYTPSGIMCGAIGTVADVFAAVKYLVFDRKLCTMKQLKAALDREWEGSDQLRMEALHRAPKWGNGNADVDEFARKAANFTAKILNSTKNHRGGTFQLGLWSINWNVIYGNRTAALPDGHKCGEPLARNTGAVIGMDKRGPTALMASATSLDQVDYADGTVLDVLLHPSAVAGTDGPDILCGLIRSYAQLGGQSIQFNILDVDTLKKAQKEPEKYSNIQVRVCGWNNRFVDLSEVEQKNFIAQAEANA